MSYVCSLIYTTAGKAQYFWNNCSISWNFKCTTILPPRLQIQAFYCFPVKKGYLAFDFFPSHGRTTRRCNKKDADLLNAHQFAETSNSSFLYSFPTQKRLPDNLVYVRIPPPDVEPATNSVHRDRRSSKTSTGSNSKDASNPNTGSVSEGIYDPNLINTITMLYIPIVRSIVWNLLHLWMN